MTGWDFLGRVVVVVGGLVGFRWWLSHRPPPPSSADQASAVGLAIAEAIRATYPTPPPPMDPEEMQKVAESVDDQLKAFVRDWGEPEDIKDWTEGFMPVDPAEDF